jgi:hypothetical protein
VNYQDGIVIAEVEMEYGITEAMSDGILGFRMSWTVILRYIISPTLELLIQLTYRCDHLVVSFILSGDGVELAVDVFLQLQ